MNESDFHKALASVLTEIGEAPGRPGLEKTPARVWESLHHLTRGYREDLAAILADATFEDSSRDSVLIRDIGFTSICEHHMLPFFGHVDVGYRPDGRLIGLSKVGRVVDHFACRLQVQENLAGQIAYTLNEILRPSALAVVVSATHLCMTARGVQKPGSVAVSFAWRGGHEAIQEFRPEFLAGIGRQKE